MAFTFAAFCYMLSLVLCAALIFFAIWHIIAFDELRTDFKSPIDQCNPVHAGDRSVPATCPLLTHEETHYHYVYGKQIASIMKHQRCHSCVQCGSEIVTATKQNKNNKTQQSKTKQQKANGYDKRERLRNIERICFLLRKLVLPEYSIHSLFCIMFLCAQEWLTLGLNVPLLFYHFWRYFHCPADSSELAYDPPVVMNADTLSYCQKEAWCKLAFYLLSFFYYLYCMIYTLVSS